MYPEECEEVYRGIYQTSDTKTYTNNKHCKNHGASNKRSTPPRNTVGSVHFKHESVIGEVTGTDTSKSETDSVRKPSNLSKSSKNDKISDKSGKSGLESCDGFMES